MRNYELVFIVHPEVDDQGLTTVVETVKGLVERVDGKVTQVDLWGMRRLAYPIQKQWEGQYVLMRLGMEPTGVAELERNLGLTEQVMRHLVVRLEDGETVGEEEPEEQAVESSEPAAE